MTAVGTKTLAPSLESLSALEHQDLRYNNIGVAAATALVSSLQRLTALQDLALDLPGSGLNKLEDLIRRTLPNVKLTMNFRMCSGYGSRAHTRLRRLASD